MIPMTCTGNRPEIQNSLLPGQCALDRPDLCNRVFKIKLKALMADLTNNLFGKAEHYLSVMEFQKRSFVHAHIVVKFKGFSPEARHEVDKGIWTNLPDERIADGKTSRKSYQVHGSQKMRRFQSECTLHDYLRKNKQDFCSKHYPQPFCERKVTNYNTGRAEYRHLDIGGKATIKQQNGERKTVETEIDN